MRIGVVFPQTEIGADPGAVRAYAQHADGLGYTHLLAYDHVLGAEPSGWPGHLSSIRRKHRDRKENSCSLFKYTSREPRVGNRGSPRAVIGLAAPLNVTFVWRTPEFPVAIANWK